MSQSGSAALEAVAVVKRFGSVVALDGVSVQIAAGECVALIGESGSGKTTLLRCFNRLTHPDQGQVLVGGADIAQEDPVRLRRTIGYVPQEGGLLPHWRVLRNVALVPWLRGEPDGDAKAAAALRLVGLEPDAFARRWPRDLSGGQRQRVAVARALAHRPEVVLLDEPFGALDARVRQELRRWLDDLHRELGVTSLLVTHDQEEALELAQTVVVMRQGNVEQIGDSEDIYNRPATPFVAGFVGASNVVNGTVFEGHVHFGRSAVAGADHLRDGQDARAYIRPHDVQVTRLPGAMSFPVEVERRTNMGWVSKLALRLEDGQTLVAEIPNEELEGIRAGEPAQANLRNAKVFALDGADPRAAAPDLVPA
jgi:ABC-type sulfate/molybdate transport systems ATPase subunit